MSIDLPDVNVLLALHFREHPQHAAALTWFGGARQVVTTAVTELGLIRLLLNPTVVLTKISGGDALTALRQFRALPKTLFWSDGASLAEPVVRVTQLQGPRQVTDLHLFNLAVSGGARFVTCDAKFAESLRAVERKHLHVLSSA